MRKKISLERRLECVDTNIKFHQKKLMIIKALHRLNFLNVWEHITEDEKGNLINDGSSEHDFVCEVEAWLTKEEEKIAKKLKTQQAVRAMLIKTQGGGL